MNTILGLQGVTMIFLCRNLILWSKRYRGCKLIGNG